MKKYLYVEAMYTIEMSILFPVIMAVLIGGISMAFYVHDITVARATINRYCNEIIGREFESDRFNEAIKREVAEHLIMGEITSVVVLEDKGHIDVTVEINYEILFWNINRSEKIKVKIDEVNCPDYIRKVRVISDEVKEILR